ncbi:UDP-N-acetylmuramoyl-L-alanyl-D-glutamate--2,6-diaminopimelate ligase [Marinobacterium sediminicola]|uniref:UDP-N-acetylmuramoyl-L-alanyl-D-glutamate--2,6-diaminopimelate ligase n=1 Tax=Marinobacterium sediminicola TaxID=518898 RepID=A0ABY1RX50_9GAMM|nr:UDP-N-acetylmuramoyl-L-alanyl-D-glutamate--2,6-diaminopimelate ligase [Marinobacterium sediminicola]ULG70216.1 UDP-N-acetylmuramoyl-L-alanyl-D-glutamate--2,6-diaminopimelate ligase [Marinobacterium sediminicola]SMR70074.1 UDP-N-acetylmuramoylalanyl-D-glutamate--2,6-diaminopimelate ligase [Marinobacterium sediminicola]
MSIYTQSLLTLLPQASSTLAALPVDRPVVVSGLTLDSRQVKPGDLFFARSGVSCRGADFIADAQQKGAVAVVVEEGELTGAERARIKVPLLEVQGLDAVVGEVASRFYGNPSQHLKVIGVTGTNGKTSCSNYLAQALELLGHRAAVIGTLGNGFLQDLKPATHTTPDAIALQALLAELKQAGAEYVVMEVSSHALDQQRVAGMRFVAAGFTNLTRDHLDYHGDMAAYGDAKAKLFVDHMPALQAINLDDVFGRTLWQQLQPVQARVEGFGLSEPGADVRVEGLAFGPEGAEFALRVGDECAAVKTSLMGSFNVSNLLLCATLLQLMEYPLAQVADVLGKVQPVAGRMQALPVVAHAPSVVVDFAHTPDALAQALQALRLHRPSEGRLICVFGCGGDRDAGKRPEMGRIVSELADQLVVTSDNPRSESPAAIIADILAGVSPEAAVHVEADRAAAIRWAIDQAAAEDLVLIAGKGHERWQEINGVKEPFDDCQQAWHVLQEGADV